MQRTTIMLPYALRIEAQRLAHEQGVSLGELIRQALLDLLRNKRDRSVDIDPLFADSAVWDDDAPVDLAANHDHYLYGGGS